MSLELIAVEGCTISHGSGSPISGGTFTIISAASSKSKVENNGIYALQIDFTFSGGNAAGMVSGSVSGAGTIIATAIKTKAENKSVVRQGDTGTLTASGTNSSPPPPALAVSGPVEISVAGQTAVKGQ